MAVRAGILLLSLIPGMMFMQVQDCCIKKPLNGRYASHRVATATLVALRRRWRRFVLTGPHAASTATHAGTQSLVLRPSPFAPNCNGPAQTGTLFMNAEVEPYVAVNPLNPSNLVGVW